MAFLHATQSSRKLGPSSTRERSSRPSLLAPLAHYCGVILTSATSFGPITSYLRILCTSFSLCALPVLSIRFVDTRASTFE